MYLTFLRRCLALCFILGLPFSLQAGVVLNEALAENDGGYRDDDGDSPDWIELHNDSAVSVNLAGWRLADQSTNTAPWYFPDVTLAPDQYLIVFASGKNRTQAGQPLHTNFKLNQTGDFLTLYQADGITIASTLNVVRARSNVSVGTSREVSTTVLFPLGSRAAYQVPLDGTLGLAWTDPAYDDTAWSSATTPLRYETLAGGTSGPPVLRLDFNDRVEDTSATTQSGFSSFAMSASPQTTLTTRSYGAYTVTVSGTGLSFDDRRRTTPVNGGALTTAAIYQDFIFSSSLVTNGGLDVQISGLTPGQTYRGTIWSYDSGSPNNRVSDWAANSVAITNGYTFNGSQLPTSDNDYQISFRAVADAGGNLLLTGRRNPTSFAANPAVFINALELAPLNTAPATNGNLAAIMPGRNASLYARQPFFVADPAALNDLTLRVAYDDGFIAYLNSVEVARRNAPADAQWNSVATAPHSAAVLEDIRLVGYANLLRSGTNMLAVHGVNVAANDSDFFLNVELLGARVTNTANQFFATPTPGAPNNAGLAGLVGDTRFSVDRGFFEVPFSVAITTATAGAQIRYTLDGNVPTATSGSIYTGPLTITNTTVLRAAAFKSGLISTRVDTQTYIFLESVLRQPNTLPGYPTLWQANYPADYEVDSNVVNHAAYSGTIRQDMRAIPTISIVTGHDGLWGAANGIYNHATSTGDAWRREASVEMIRPDGKTAFAVTAGLQMQGNASRDNIRTPKHSMRLVFQDTYGPAKLRYNLFGRGVEEFDNIILRGVFTDSWATRYSDSTVVDNTATPPWRGTRYRPEDSLLMRDAWIKDTYRAMGHLAARSDYAHVYLNGLYWGVYNPSERMDSSFVSSHLGGQKDDWDVLVGGDTSNIAEVADGNKNDWNQMMAIVNAGITNEVAFSALSRHLDITGLIDYMILHIAGEAEDWPHHNWYAAHRRATNGLPATRWIILPWDQDIVLDRVSRRNRIDVNNADTPARIYSQLRAYPEFRRMFGDRLQTHLFNGGALTAEASAARMVARANRLQQAIVGESARWGDAREFATPGNPATAQTFTRDQYWLPELQKLYTNYFVSLPSINITRFRAGNLFPSISAPVLTPFGGRAPAGTLVTASAEAGFVYYTLDGSDPRMPGTMAIAPTAIPYRSSIVVTNHLTVRARSLDNGNWSALVEASFLVGEPGSPVRISEIMHNPPEGSAHEFIELLNPSAVTVELAGYYFSGIDYTFGPGARLAPGERLVLISNEDPVAFARKYPGLEWYGTFGGALDNAGEEILLLNPQGIRATGHRYSNNGFWPAAANGGGASIEWIDSLANSLSPYAWRATLNGGTPGRPPEPRAYSVVINELMAANNVVTNEAGVYSDWVELKNVTAAPIDLRGWSITDNTNPRRFVFTTSVLIPAGGYLVVWADSLGTPGIHTGFGLSQGGEQLALYDSQTNLVDGVQFGPQIPGSSLGRIRDQWTLTQPTPREENLIRNTAPATNAILNEWLAYPLGTADDQLEIYAALSPLPLSLNGFYVTVNSNWARLPEHVFLDPNRFQVFAASGDLQPDELAVRLPSAGATVRLYDGGGHLLNEAVYGPQFEGVTSGRSPDGSTNIIHFLDGPSLGNYNDGDADGDGIPDSWESRYGFNPLGAQQHAVLDSDGDGLTNAQEYRAGTSPIAADSLLRISGFQAITGRLQFVFDVPFGRTYVVQSAEDPVAGPWRDEQAIERTGQPRTITFVDSPPPVPQRFYRLVAK